MTAMMPLLAVGSMALLALLLNLWQLKQIRQLKNAVATLMQPAKEVGTQQEPSEKASRASFSVSLTQAEQKKSEPSPGHISQTDKYRYIASLAEQGLDADKIAAALQMSTVEVEQLMQLARLKQRHTN